MEVGKELVSNLMLSGTIQKISKTIVISFRLIDVEKEKIIRSHVAEYLVMPEELQTMVQVSIRKLQTHLKKLPKKLSTVQLREVRARLKSVGGLNLPMPKGPMPTNLKMPRR